MMSDERVVAISCGHDIIEYYQDNYSEATHTKVDAAVDAIADIMFALHSMGEDAHAKSHEALCTYYMQLDKDGAS